MAVEQKVVVRVEIDPDMSKAAAVNATLAMFDRNAKQSKKSLDNLSRSLAGDFAKAMGRVGQLMGQFGAKIIKINLKAFGIELAAVTAGLLTMKAALATGQAVMRAWGSTVSFLKVGVAGLTAGLVSLVATISAANRQFAQVQLMPFVGGLQQASQAMAGMRMPSVAQMGVQNLNQLASTLARGGVGVKNIGSLTRAFGNFTGGDVKATQGMATAWTQMMESGSRESVVAQMKSMGPAYKEAVKQFQGYKGSDPMQAFIRGEFTPDQFKDSLGNLDQTVMGGFKGMITKFYNQLADMGAIFLDPLRNAMTQIEGIVKTGLLRVQGTINAFGLHTFMPGLVNSVERVTNFFVRLIVQDLPRLMEVMGKIADWWRDFKAGTSRFFERLGDSMKKYSDSAAIAWEMTKNLFGEIGGFISGRMNQWNDLINQNAGDFERFGTAFGGAFTGVLDVITRTKDEFFRILPEVNDFLQFLKEDVFPVMADFASNFITAFKSALPVVQRLTNAFMPLLKMLNGLIGALAAMPGGLGGLMVLGAGWLSMTRGGQAGFGYMRQGFMGTGTKPTSAFGGLGYGIGQFFGGGRSSFNLLRNGGLAPGPNLDGTAGIPIPGVGTKKALMTTAKNVLGSQGGMGMGLMMAGMLIGQATGNAGVGGALSSGIGAGSIGRMLIGGNKGWGAAGLMMGTSMLAGSQGYDTATQGAVTGGIGGASIGMGLMATGVPHAVAAGLIITGASAALGWFRGKRNAEKKEKKTQTSVLDMFTDIGGFGGITSRQGILDASGEFQQLFRLGEDGERSSDFKNWVRNNNLDEDTAWALGQDTSGMMADVAAAAIGRLNASVAKLAQITGLSAHEVEEAANRMGIALHEHHQMVGGTASNAYSMLQFATEFWSDYRTTTTAGGISMFNDAGVKAYGNRINQNLFKTNIARRSAIDESRAINNVALQEILTTGSLSDETANAMIQAMMGQAAAQGITSGSGFAKYGTDFAAGLIAFDKANNLGGAFNPLANELMKISNVAFDDFKGSTEVKQLKGLAGMVNPLTGKTFGEEAWGPLAGKQGIDDKMLKKMWEDGSIEEQLASLNMQLWKNAADAQNEFSEALASGKAVLVDFAAQAVLAGQALGTIPILDESRAATEDGIIHTDNGPLHIDMGISATYERDAMMGLPQGTTWGILQDAIK